MASVARYRDLVERLEREARQSPGLYRFKLGLLAGLGFAVLGGTVLLALGMSVGLVLVLVAISPLLLLKLIKVIWIPVAFGWFVLKSLWIRMEPRRATCCATARRRTFVPRSSGCASRPAHRR